MRLRTGLNEAFIQIEKVANLIGQVSDVARDNTLAILGNKQRIVKLERKVSDLETGAMLSQTDGTL